jgi:hypothetical protein
MDLQMALINDLRRTVENLQLEVAGLKHTLTRGSNNLSLDQGGDGGGSGDHNDRQGFNYKVNC